MEPNDVTSYSSILDCPQNLGVTERIKIAVENEYFTVRFSHVMKMEMNVI